MSKMYRMCIIVYWCPGEVVSVIICDMYELHLSMYQSRVTGVGRRDDATFGIALKLDPSHSGTKTTYGPSTPRHCDRDLIFLKIYLTLNNVISSAIYFVYGPLN